MRVPSMRQVEAAVQADPNLAEAHELLGNLLARKGEVEGALREYREALRARPEFSRAHLALGSALALTGDVSGATAHLRQAAAGCDTTVRREALQILQQLSGGR
jgi:Flp pilus assembly protein TadD